MSEQYRYVAIDPRGARLSGLVTDENLDRAADQVRRLGLRPIDLTVEKQSVLKTEIVIPAFGRGQQRKELTVFARQFAVMTAAGLPLLRSLSTLALQARDLEFRRVLQSLASSLASGDPLSAAMAQHSRWFDDLFVSMVHAGESSGRLDDVLEQVAEANERTASMRRKLRSAISYPVAILSLALLILLGLLIFMVPTMKKIYADTGGGSLPLPTRIVITISDPLVAMVPFGHSVLGSLIRIVMLTSSITICIKMFKLWKKTPEGHLLLAKLTLRIPLIGELVTKSSIARFARSVSVLERAGVPLVDCVRTAAATANNEAIANALRTSADDVTGGASLSTAMSQHLFFPPMVVQMVAVGEETGDLSTMFIKVAEFYESEVSATVDTLTSLLEPIMLVVMGGLIGGILVSLYLPMFSVISRIK